MASFVDLQIGEPDPDGAIAACFARMATAFPGWEPSEGAPEVWLIRVLSAVIGAPLAQVASQVPAEVFRQFGEQVHGVVPLDAVAATATATVVATDNAGYTLPVGTQFAISTAGDTSVGFRSLTEVQIPAGSTSTGVGEVVLQAAIAGTEANGLSADPELVDSLAWVSSVTLETTTSGGVDAETGDEYLDRLRDTLTTLSQNAIIPADVEVLALGVAGVERAVAIDLFAPGTNEVQTVTVTGSPSGGNYTVKIGAGGSPSGTIAHNATGTAFQTALIASADIGPHDVLVTGNAGGPYTITFVGSLAATNIAQLQLGTNSLTGGSSPAPAFATTTGGVAANAASEKTVTVAVVDEDGAALSTPVKTAVADLLELHREVNFVWHVIDPTFNEIDVQADVVARPGFDQAGVEAAVEQAITDYLDPANWGIPSENQGSQYPGGWRNQTTVRRNELIALVDKVDSVDYVSNVQLSLSPDALGTADLTLYGPASLTTPGDIVCNAS